MNIVPVVAAIITSPGASTLREEILLARCYSNTKPERNGKLEFPGGKIEIGEQPEEALVREILEELSCRIEVGKLICAQNNIYSDGTNNLVLYYRCVLKRGQPKGEVFWYSLPYIQRNPGQLSAMVSMGVMSVIRELKCT